MEISFTTEEYRSLLDLIFIASRIIEANSVIEEKKEETYQKISQKIYSYAEKSNCNDLIAYDKKSNRYVGRSELENRNFETIDEYNESFFRYLLTLNFTWKDIKKDITEAEFEKLSDQERLDLISQYSKKWNDIFTEHGIDKLELKND